MALLANITEESLGIASSSSEKTPVQSREAARAVIFNKEGKVALLFADRDSYHKLPGGGIEDGEDWRVAVVREAIEEVGCSITVRPNDLGTVTETRLEHGLQQTSYCCIGDVDGEISTTQLTEQEIGDGIEPPKWVDLDEAINLVKNDTPKSYLGKFIQARDLAFLESAKRSLAE